MINQAANSLFAATLLRPPISSGVALQIASGVFGQYFNPLNARPFAAATLPEFVSLRCFIGCSPLCCFPPPRCGPLTIDFPGPEPVQQWTAKTTGEGRAEVDLGDGYTLKFNERSSEIEVFNANTGEHTRIWGDPHVDVDGERAFDFWGTTTFRLENDTKITINTEQWNGNPNAYVASQVVITKGSNALVVDGISQNQLGDLELTLSNRGYAVDIAHRDGYQLRENATGAGWRSDYTGEIATQADLDATRVGARFGPGSQLPSWQETLPLFSHFLMFGRLLNFAADLGEDLRQVPEPKPQIPC